MPFQRAGSPFARIRQRVVLHAKIHLNYLDRYDELVALEPKRKRPWMSYGDLCWRISDPQHRIEYRWACRAQNHPALVAAMRQGISDVWQKDAHAPSSIWDLEQKHASAWPQLQARDT